MTKASLHPVDVESEPAVTPRSTMHSLNEMINGNPAISAICTCAKLGGFEMMASAAKDRPVFSSG